MTAVFFYDKIAQPKNNKDPLVLDLRKELSEFLEKHPDPIKGAEGRLEFIMEEGFGGAFGIYIGFMIIRRARGAGRG